MKEILMDGELNMAIYGIELSLRYGSDIGMILYDDCGNEIKEIPIRLSWEEIYCIKLQLDGSEVHCIVWKDDNYEDDYSLDELRVLMECEVNG